MSGKTIALIGCGRWGRNILRDLLSLGCRVVVAERSEAGRAHAREAGADPVCEDLSVLPQNVDGYIVAVQTEYHYSVLKQLANTGKPVFVEKPLAPDVSQARELIGLMGDRTFVMHKWRYHPGIEMLAQIRASGRFGRVGRLVSRRLQWSHPHKDVDALWILGPHDLSIALHVLGELPPLKSLQADVANGKIQGALVLLGDDPAVSIEMSVLHPLQDRLVCVHFERAVVSLLDPLADHLEVRHLDKNGEPTAAVELIPIATDLPLLLEIKAFLNYLGGGHAPLSPLTDEVEVIGILSEIRARALRLSRD